MSFGIKALDGAGVAIVDTSDRLTRLYGIYTVSYSAGYWSGTTWIPPSGNTTITGMSDDGSWFVHFNTNDFIGIEIFSGYLTWTAITGPSTSTFLVFRC